MSRPVIITCAITGSRPRKSDNPAVPLSSSEQIESAQEAFEAGASLLHLHVRDDQGRPTLATDRFAMVMEGVRQYCPGMIIELSTSNDMTDPTRSPDHIEMLSLRPDMAAVTLGSVNFPMQVYYNPPEEIENICQEVTSLGLKPTIEVFDLSMLYTARRMLGQGQLKMPLHFHIVLGSQAALPAHRQILDFIVCEVQDMYPGSTWTASGLGAHQEVVMDWALYLGGHIRTGLEDNVRFNHEDLATGNGAMVQRAVKHCINYGTHAASVREARYLLGLESGVRQE